MVTVFCLSRDVAIVVGKRVEFFSLHCTVQVKTKTVSAYRQCKPLVSEQALLLGESREDTREPHVKGDVSARSGGLRRSLARSLATPNGGLTRRLGTVTDTEGFF